MGLTNGRGIAFGDDAISFWGAAHLALQGRVVEVYNVLRFNEFQSSVLGAPIHLYRYNYPPVTILVTLPLGLLRYPAGMACWLVGGWLCFVAAVRASWPSAERSPGDIVLYAAVVPAVLVNMMTGQTGTWIAGILAYGLLSLDRSPIRAGILLGLLVVKPHVALLVPFALLAQRRWASLIVCGATAAALIALSIVLFGWDAWEGFFRNAQLAQQWDLDDGRGVWQIQTSVFTAVRHLSAGLSVAYACQIVAALGAICIVWRCWSSGGPQAAKNAVLVVAGIFVTPYVNVYDLAASALVPLWLLGRFPSEITRSRMMILSFMLLLATPLIAPPFAEATGISVGLLLLSPSLFVCVRLAWRPA